MGSLFRYKLLNQKSLVGTSSLTQHLTSYQHQGLKEGGYDESQLDYVSNWSDWEGVEMSKLFEIYRDLTWQENNDNKEKAHSDMCEYMEAVEQGEITYL